MAEASQFFLNIMRQRFRNSIIICTSPKLYIPKARSYNFLANSTRSEILKKRTPKEESEKFAGIISKEIKGVRKKSNVSLFFSHFFKYYIPVSKSTNHNNKIRWNRYQRAAMQSERGWKSQQNSRSRIRTKLYTLQKRQNNKK